MKPRPLATCPICHRSFTLTKDANPDAKLHPCSHPACRKGVARLNFRFADVYHRDDREWTETRSGKWVKL